MHTLIRKKQKYYSVADYAGMNQVTPKTIYEWLKSGKLDSTYVGKMLFVRLK